MAIRTGSRVLFLVVLLLGETASMGDDVIILTNGSRYPHTGTIRKEGDTYIIQGQSGHTRKLPARFVREVIRSEDMLTIWKGLLGKADLASDTDVFQLLQRAKELGLTRQREEILEKAFDLRLEKAGADIPALVKLEGWCRRVKSDKHLALVTDERLQTTLAAKSRQAGNAPMAWVRLSLWCEQNSLPWDASRARNKALALGPNNPNVRMALGLKPASSEQFF